MESSSIYRQVAEAARSLMKKPEVFTEPDIVNAVPNNQVWSNRQWKEAGKAAAAICAAQYRATKLVRFGPVKVPGLDEPDYARRGEGGKIVYAAKGLVNTFVTPNGTFPALPYKDDQITRGGRRKGNRDDTRPWAGQTMGFARDDETIPPDPEEELRTQIERLRADLKAANKAVEALTHENDRLRSVGATTPQRTILIEVPMSPDLIEQLAEELAPALRQQLAEPEAAAA